MEKVSFTFSFFVLILAGSLAASCGASQSHGQLQSMSLSPIIADARNYPNGQVQFTATGYYVNPLHTVTPQSGTWVACQNNAPASDVSVTNVGVAQCGVGASGTYSIDAWNPSTASGTYSCPSQNACGGGCTIEATAHLMRP